VYSWFSIINCLRPTGRSWIVSLANKSGAGGLPGVLQGNFAIYILHTFVVYGYVRRLCSDSSVINRRYIPELLTLNKFLQMLLHIIIGFSSPS
jgi:hypothetical protein